jgi:hypothetical protein
MIHPPSVRGQRRRSPVRRKDSIRDAEPDRLTRGRWEIRCLGPNLCRSSATMVHELMTSLARTLARMLRSRAALLAEDVLLRQQIIVLRRAAPHPRLRTRDRLAIPAMTGQARPPCHLEDSRQVPTGARSLVTPPRAPQANAFCERTIGTLRRDCLGCAGKRRAGRADCRRCGPCRRRRCAADPCSAGSITSTPLPLGHGLGCSAVSRAVATSA